MTDEQRQIYFDSDLQIEAYYLKGVVQKFLNHFHDYYVIDLLKAVKISSVRSVTLL